MERIGHYRIVSELGRGGMGVVYKAHEESLNRFVAIKVLGKHLVEDPTYVERFVREAQSAAKLHHPNIVQIYTIDEEDGVHYFVMEYVSGTSLQQMLRDDGKMEGAQAARLVLQTAGGLKAAHDQEIIHRDIKPANLLIDQHGLVKIADFGLALMADAASRLTATGMFMGTPGYLSPEQCLDRDIDHRTDIYSLGATFFEMITGSTPFKATSPLALLRQIIEVEPPDVRELNPDVDEDTRTILKRMMAKDPDQRYPGCGELIADLQSYLEGNGVSRSEIDQVAAGVSAAVPAAAAPAAGVPASVTETVRMDTAPAVVAPPPAPPTPPPAADTVDQAPPPPPAPEPVPIEPSPASGVGQPPASPRRGRAGLLVALVAVVVLLGLIGATALVVKNRLARRARNLLVTRSTETAGTTASGEAAGAATVAQGAPASTAEAPGAGGSDAGAAAGVAAGSTTSETTVGAAAPASTGAKGAGGPTSSATSSVRAGRSGTAGASSASAQPSTKAATSARPPREAVPPPPPRRGTIVVAVGERLLAGEAEAFVERGLRRRGVRLVDENGLPRLRDLLDGGEPGATALIAAARPYARTLVVVRAEYLGDRPLRFMGRVERAFQSRLTVTPFDLAEGRGANAVNEKVEYTQVSVGRVVEQTLQPEMRDLVTHLRRR